MMLKITLLLTIPVTTWMTIGSSGGDADHKAIRQVALDYAESW